MAGNTLPEVRKRFGEFHDWYMERPQLPANYRVITAYNGNPLPDFHESDGWIITGASESVNDPLPWLPDARGRIAVAVDAGHAILGVCFGHQLLSSSLGGMVTKNPAGWELGQVQVFLTADGVKSALLEGLHSPSHVYATHREIVDSPPADAVILAENDMGLQAQQVGPRAYGVQFHPEFTAAIATVYAELRGASGTVGPGALHGAGDAGSQVLTNFIKIVSH